MIISVGKTHLHVLKGKKSDQILLYKSNYDFFLFWREFGNMSWSSTTLVPTNK